MPRDFDSIDSIEFENVSFGYEGDEPILENTFYKFSNAKRIWIRGQIGGGRSTIFRLIMGLVQPNKGRILVNGKDISELSFAELTQIRRLIGYAPDYKGLLTHLSIEQNLFFPLQLRKGLTAYEIEARVNIMIQMMELQKVRYKMPPVVSHGHYKAALLARALICDPQILLLDEPMSGLTDSILERFLAMIDDGFAADSLKQIIFTGEHAFLGEVWNPEEAFLVHGSLCKSIL